MSSPTSVVVSSCEYWMRIAISLHLCVKKALLDILHDPNINGLPRNEQQLFQKLHQFKQNQQKALKNVIKQYKWEKMCHCCSASCPNPCPHQGKTKAEDLDITCIVVLIINLTMLPPPQGGWKNTPKPNDTSKAAFVLLARQLRNDINHCAVEDISTQQEFNMYWNIMESVLLGLQVANMKLFHGLKTISLDANTGLRITGLAGQMNLRITSLIDQMCDLRDDIEILSQKTDKMVDQLQRIINGIKQQLTGLETDKYSSESQLKALQEKLNSLEESLKERFTNAESKIEEYEQMFSQQLEANTLKDQQISQHDEQISQQVQQITQHHQQIIQHSQQISQQEKRISQVEVNLHHLQKTTSNTNDLEKLSEAIKNWTKQRYEHVFVTFERSGLHPPKSNKREDIVVELSFIKDAEKAFFQAADNNNAEEEISKQLEVGIYRDTPSIIQKMRNELEEVSSQQTDYNDIMTSPNDYVIISGAPGCGKTTLCQTLAYGWACDKIWIDHPKFQFVFMLKFCELNRFKNDQDVTAEGILSHFYPEDFSEKTTPTLKNNSLLILDGFDECFNKYNLLGQEGEFTNYTHALYDLLDPHNKKLPSARLVTSRPASCSVLFRLLKSEQCQLRLFEVTGFSMENIKKYVMHYYQQTSHSSDVQQEKLKKFLAEVEHSPILRSLMTIPFYCNGVCCLMLDGALDIRSIPLTYTGLFSTLLTLFLRNHGLRNSKLCLTDVLRKENTKQMILMLSKFAFSMELKGKIIFTKSDFPEEFDNHTIIEELVERTGLILKLDHEDEPFYQFVHYSFHEFLVALHLFHIGSTQSSTNPYILSMVGGLIGGLVTRSKSNLFVKNYARMFQSGQSIDIEVLLRGDGYGRVSEFLAIVFEYKNRLHLKKRTTIRMTYASYAKEHYVQHYVNSSRDKHIEIDSVLIIADLECLHTHGELVVALTQSAISKVLFMDNDSFYAIYSKENPSMVRLFQSNIHFTRLILFKEVLGMPEFLNIASLTNELEFIDYFDLNSVEDDSYGLPVGNVNLTIHMEVSKFVEAISAVHYYWNEWRIKLQRHCCKSFKSVTLSLCKDNKIQDFNHSHDSHCISPEFIREVKQVIVENYHQINNIYLKFAASCTLGAKLGIAPFICKI